MPHHLSEPDDNVAVDEGGTPVKAPTNSYYADTIDSYHSAVGAKPHWNVQKVQIYDVSGQMMTVYPKKISMDTSHSYHIHLGPKIELKLAIEVDHLEISDV